MENTNKNNIFKDNVENTLGEYFKKLNNVIDAMPTGNKKELSEENSPTVTTDDEKNLLCDKINEIVAITDWSVTLVATMTELPMYTIMLLCDILGESYEIVMTTLQNSPEKMSEWINEKLSSGVNVKKKKHKKLYRKLMILVAKINKALKVAQRLTYKIMKGVLQRTASGKMMNAGIAFINGFIQMFKALAAILDIAMNFINKIIQALPIMLQLDGELMGFFITPKSLNTVTLTPTNDQVSIFSGISNEIFYAINEYISGIKTSEKISNGTKIAAAGAEAANKGEIGDSPEFDMESITPKKINDKVKMLLSLFIQSEPLPEYKRLKITNLGYQMWLNTSFEQGMKRSFGLPGFP